MRAADALFQALQAEGVEHVFGIPGGANLPIYDALYDAELTHIQARNEAGAGHDLVPAAQGLAGSMPITRALGSDRSTLTLCGVRPSPLLPASSRASTRM